MRSWYVARTKPHQEQQTAVVLGERGIETYLPKITPSRRSPLVTRPELLFPGYLFVRLHLESDWRQVRCAPGISYFLGGAGTPTKLPDELVDEVRARVSRHEVERRVGFRRGERVRIVGGAMDGIEAVFERERSGSSRSRILVDIVGRLVPVEIEGTKLRPLG